MPCEHDLAERETACYADGLCPICLKAELERMTAANAKLLEQFLKSNANFVRAVEQNERLLRRHLGMPSRDGGTEIVNG